MRNWQDYVGLQLKDFIQNDNVNELCAYVFKSVRDTDGHLSHWAEKLIVPKEQFKFTIDDIGDAVESMMSEFPSIVITSKFDLQRAKNDVSCYTNRGAANTNFGSTWFYRSDSLDENGQRSRKSESDCAIIVVERDDRYALVKHPLFNNYGFNIS